MKLPISNSRLATVILSLSMLAMSQSACAEDSQNTEMEEITVWGQKNPISKSNKNSPSTEVTPEDMVSANTVMTEDLVKYEPGVVIRQRYIGDSNGTLGMRGSNMFQTSRSMVFADGVPLHYFLQTRWSGAPRWSLVSADEISEVKVIYGPFSAEYGGNAMGGVVAIETEIPTERQVRFQVTGFEQEFDDVGYKDSLGGDKIFVSYGDKFDKFSFYASYNHVKNLSQPMSFQFSRPGVPTGAEEITTGAVLDTNEYETSVLYFADAGETQSTADQFKIKVGHEFNSWLTVIHLAYEDRNMVQDSVNNYLRDATGNLVWNGDFVQAGKSISVASDDFAISEQDRRSLLIGGRIQGQLGDSWWLEAGLSRFEILEDESRESDSNPADPLFTPAGGITDYKDTGWETAAVKLFTDQLFGSDRLNMIVGYQYEHYSLQINNYTSNDFINGLKSNLHISSGGESSINALFAQFGWDLSGNWDISLGIRYEDWDTEDGFYYNIAAADLQDHIDRSEERFSPKFSTGYRFDNLKLRYSFARANRFPIVEELFQNERKTSGTSLANANLDPEYGLHHNLMLEHELNGGYVRANLFFETIDDVIFAQTAIVDNKRMKTFIPVDQVETNGLELILNKRNILNGKVDIRFNIAFLDSEIIRNQANTLLEGKTFPRMPKRRANLLVTWRVTDAIDFGGGVRYASNSYGDLDNADRASKVYGAHDSYFLLNLKGNYQLNEMLKLSLGINNVFNEIAYVHHPWPGRTIFMDASLEI